MKRLMRLRSVLAPDVLQAAALIGAVTALGAAIVAIAQRDVRRVLAWSTISQVGLMFVAAGLGALFAARFQLIAHVLLKAVLVLGAGSVRRATGDESDIARYGGLGRRMPWTAGAFAIVLEVIPATLGRIITRQLKIPTIGIGAGPDTDAQVLVINDLLGLTFGRPAKFVRQYADLRTTMSEAIKSFADDVRNANYPASQESYDVSREVAEQLERLTDQEESNYVLFAE